MPRMQGFPPITAGSRVMRVSCGMSGNPASLFPLSTILAGRPNLFVAKASSARRFPCLGSARPVVRQSEHGWFTDFDPAPIHKRTAIDDRPVLLGTPFSEAVDSIKLEREHTAFRGMDL